MISVEVIIIWNLYGKAIRALSVKIMATIMLFLLWRKNNVMIQKLAHLCDHVGNACIFSACIISVKLGADKAGIGQDYRRLLNTLVVTTAATLLGDPKPVD